MDKIKIKSNSRNSNKKRSFYVALGICLAAIGIASFVTYNNVKNYVLKENLSKQSMEFSKQLKNNTNKPPDSCTNYEQDNFENYQCDNDNVPETVKPVETDNIDIPVKAQKAGSINYPSESKDILKNYSGDNPVFSKTFNDWRIHNGVDFALEKGSRVISITKGTVKNVFKDPVYGITVEVEHDGDFTAFYAGLNEDILVKINDLIEAEQQIGTVGNVPGESKDEPHLHLSIKKSDRFIDPMKILGQQN